MTCEECGQDTRDTPFCVRCGHQQAVAGVPSTKRGYGANPSERPVALKLASTLFPQLPSDDMRAFQVALAFGVVVVVALGIVGAFSVAIIAAAVVVPLVLVVYLYDVDVYEDEPLRVYLLTFAWGAVAGAVVGLVLRTVVHLNPLGQGPDAAFILGRGVLVPIVSVALMLVGPLVLLPYKRFNDMLDGATFGATTAAAFVGAQIIAQSIDLLRAGLQPGGDAALWVARLLAQGVALPLIAAGGVGAACGALWLRYRSPRDAHARLGVLGQPSAAIAAAAALLVVAELARLLLDEILALGVQVVMAMIALVWLRLVLHGGLMQESLERPIGSEAMCANCGRETPTHTFCGMCGVAIRALPKRRQQAPTVEMSQAAKP